MARADAIFVGATTPDANGFRGWFDIESTGVSCGVAHAINKNNWSQQWCDTMPPSSNGPVGGAVDLNGALVTAYIDTTTSSLLNPIGGTFSTGGIAHHTWGTFINNGTVVDSRVVSSTLITGTSITNNGTWIDVGGGLGTFMSDVSFSNHGLLRDGNPGASIFWSRGTNPPFTGPVTLTNETDGIIRTSTANTGHFNGLNITNLGLIESSGTGNVEITDCSVTGDTRGSWNSLAAGSTNLGLGFAGTTTMRGVFNGDAQRYGTHRLNGNVVFDADTTLNISGNGFFRWVANSLTVQSGKTLTNKGVFHTLNTASFTGKFVNDGTWLEDGGTNFVDATIVNNGTISRDGAGTLQPGAGSSTHTLINNGTLESIAGAAQGTFGAIRLENTGLVRNKAGGSGRMFFIGTTITSTPNASWLVLGEGTAGFEFVDTTVSGTFNGDTPGNNAWRINQSMNVTDNTTFNITNGGISRWVANTCNIAAGKTLTNKGVFNHLNGWAIAGNIVNDGTWNLLSGQTVFNGHTFTNNGTINWNIHDFTNQGGSSGNLFTNNGTLTVGESGIGNIVPAVVNNGLIEIGSKARWGSEFMSFSQGADGVVRLDDDDSKFDVPSTTLIGGTVAGRGHIRVPFFGLLTLNNYTIAPGNPSAPGGALVFEAGLAMGGDTTYRPHVFGADAGQIDSIWSVGSMAVGGKLDVQFEKGFTPKVGQTWTIASGSVRTGEFKEVGATADGLTVELKMAYNATDVQVTVASVAAASTGGGNNDGGNMNGNPDNGNPDQTPDNMTGEMPDTGHDAPAAAQGSSSCGAGACGAGSLSMLPMMLAGMGMCRRRRAKHQRNMDCMG